MPAHIEVQNLRELTAAVRRAAGPEAAKAIRKAGLFAVAEIVTVARHDVPKRSGRLEASIGGGATARMAYVKAGTPKRVPYAGPINYGWHAGNMSRALAKSRSPYWRNVGRKGVRGIKGDHFLDGAVAKELPMVVHRYETAMREALDGIDVG